MNRQTTEVVTLLLDAAKLAMRGVAAAATTSKVDTDPERTATILAIWSAAAGEDIAAEIERIRNAGGPDEPPDTAQRDFER